MNVPAPAALKDFVGQLQTLSTRPHFTTHFSGMGAKAADTQTKKAGVPVEISPGHESFAAMVAAELTAPVYHAYVLKMPLQDAGVVTDEAPPEATPEGGDLANLDGQAAAGEYGALEPGKFEAGRGFVGGSPQLKFGPPQQGPLKTIPAPEAGKQALPSSLALSGSGVHFAFQRSSAQPSSAKPVDQATVHTVQSFGVQPPPTTPDEVLAPVTVDKPVLDAAEPPLAQLPSLDIPVKADPVRLAQRVEKTEPEPSAPEFHEVSEAEAALLHPAAPAQQAPVLQVRAKQAPAKKAAVVDAGQPAEAPPSVPVRPETPPQSPRAAAARLDPKPEKPLEHTTANPKPPEAAPTMPIVAPAAEVPPPPAAQPVTSPAAAPIRTAPQAKNTGTGQGTADHASRLPKSHTPPPEELVSTAVAQQPTNNEAAPKTNNDAADAGDNSKPLATPSVALPEALPSRGEQKPMDPVLDIRIRESSPAPDAEPPKPAAVVRNGNGHLTQSAHVEVLPAHPEPALRSTTEQAIPTEKPSAPPVLSPLVEPHAPRPEARPSFSANSPQTAAPSSAFYAERAEQPQPLRAFSLEFTPDGAKEVKLHVSQQSGSVHISLHSNDTSLSGKLRDGMHDLVGNLSQAGYEADAWTRQDGGRRRQPEPEPETPKPTRRGTDDETAFDNIIQFQSKEQK